MSVPRIAHIQQLSLAREPGQTLTIYLTPVDRNGKDLGESVTYTFSDDNSVSVGTASGLTIERPIVDFRFSTTNRMRYSRNRDASGAEIYSSDTAAMAYVEAVTTGLLSELL